ncbi:MarR family transcriptional regulator [Lactobacillus sp. XV13L]|nr:MarR family transcriptional regulator [Lactobacillus sp. XV13L]
MVEKELNHEMHNLFTEFNLTGTQVALLTYLYEARSRTVSQKELEKVFAISHPTIRSIVKRLEQRNLINIATLKSDKRQIILSLSARGSTLIGDNIMNIYQIMTKVNHKITLGMTISEQEQLTEILQKVIHNFNM